MKGNYCEGLRPQLEAVQVCLGQWMCVLGALVLVRRQICACQLHL